MVVFAEVILSDVHADARAYAVLYLLLSEREPRQNISHRQMPTWDQHVAFVDLRPYVAWYLVEDDGAPAGAIYLTRNDEIGIAIRPGHRGLGLGRQAVEALRIRHPRPRYLANINPQNSQSIAFFEAMGFRHIQNTYEGT